jgi:CRP-like cAMP-binding protein
VNPKLERVEIGRLDQIRTLRRLYGSEPRIPAAPLAALAAHVATVRIPAGTELHSPTEPVSDTYLVVEGELVVRYLGGRPKPFGPQSGVGILPALAKVDHGYHSWASRDSVALTLRIEDMLEVYEDHFELMHASLRALAREGIELRRQLRPHAGFSNVMLESPTCPVQPLDLVERVLCLRRNFGLGHSHVDELAELARGASEVRYAAGTPLWAAGAPAESMLLMMCGSVRGHTPEGLDFQLGAGDIVGGVDMVAEQPRWFDATVQEDMVALSFNREGLIDLLEDQPELGFDFLKLMATTLLSLRAQVVERTAEPVPPSAADDSLRG